MRDQRSLFVWDFPENYPTPKLSDLISTKMWVELFWNSNGKNSQRTVLKYLNSFRAWANLIKDVRPGSKFQEAIIGYDPQCMVVCTLNIKRIEAPLEMGRCKIEWDPCVPLSFGWNERPKRLCPMTSPVKVHFGHDLVSPLGNLQPFTLNWAHFFREPTQDLTDLSHKVLWLDKWKTRPFPHFSNICSQCFKFTLISPSIGANHSMRL